MANNDSGFISNHYICIVIYMELQMFLFLAMVANRIFVDFEVNEEAGSLRYDEVKGGFHLSAEVQFILCLFEGTHDVCF